MASPGPGGIARPPVTPQLGAGTATPQTRAEAFLRRIAPTEADLPPGGVPQPARFGEEQPPGGTGPGRAFSYETGFTYPDPSQSASGSLSAVRYTGFAFPDEASARANQTAIGAALTAVTPDRLFAPGSEPRPERRTDLALGDETIAWRTAGPSAALPGAEAVRWAMVVRRGAAGYVLVVEGVGGTPDRIATELAGRLEGRMTSALQAGAWP